MELAWKNKIKLNLKREGEWCMKRDFLPKKPKHGESPTNKKCTDPALIHPKCVSNRYLGNIFWNSSFITCSLLVWVAKEGESMATSLDYYCWSCTKLSRSCWMWLQNRLQHKKVQLQICWSSMHWIMQVQMCSREYGSKSIKLNSSFAI